MKKAISLFSGCGGDTLGLERAGYTVVAFNEFKRAAHDTHIVNFPESVLIKGDKGVTDITKIPDTAFMPYKGADVVFAGFPCQGTSSAGKRKVTDPRNQMFRQFARVAKVVQPAFVIGENVPGLLSMRSGPSENDPLLFEQIRSAFAEIGYTLTYQVLEANEFGVPQKRKRLLIVGWRGELDTASFWASVSAWGATQTAPKLRSFVRATLEGALELLPAAIPEDFITVALPIPEDAEPSGTPHPFIVLKANSFGEVYNGKTMNRLLSCGKRDSPIHSEILDLDRDCKTIICTYDHQPRLLVGLRKPSGKSYVRCLLPEELKQIQGFPASFEITGTPKEKVVQIGNAVPPALVEAVARHLVSSASSFPPLPKKRKIQRQAPQTTGADAATHPPETPL